MSRSMSSRGDVEHVALGGTRSRARAREESELYRTCWQWGLETEPTLPYGMTLQTNPSNCRSESRADRRILITLSGGSVHHHQARRSIWSHDAPTDDALGKPGAVKAILRSRVWRGGRDIICTGRGNCFGNGPDPAHTRFPHPGQALARSRSEPATHGKRRAVVFAKRRDDRMCWARRTTRSPARRCRKVSKQFSAIRLVAGAYVASRA